MCAFLGGNVLQKMNIYCSTVLHFMGFILYVIDIVTDICLFGNYVKNGQYLWGGLTMMFVITGTLSSQPFSYAWYRDDAEESKTLKAGVTVHFFGLGTLIRYYHLLKESCRVARTTATSPTAEGTGTERNRLFCMAADLCMLRMFETFLESVPQILLQLYIIHDQNESSVFQWLSLAFSLSNVAYTLTDYRVSLRRSLPHARGIPSIPSRLVYLFYKLFTITSHILSYSLLLSLSVYSIVALTVLWLLMTVWVHFLKTDFCTSKGLEFFYRLIVGVILVFTFFNVKGQNTELAMTVYYMLYAIINIIAPILSVFLVGELQTYSFLYIICVIGGTTILGFMCLILHYCYLHPRRMQESDEVDGLETEAKATRRMRRFLQL